MSEQYPGGFINKTAPTLNPALGNAAPGVWNMTQVQQAVKAGTWPAYDPYSKYTTLLLHGDGTNGGQNNTFLDSSTNNFTITRNGNTTQGSFSPYGSNWSNYFDGAGDSLSYTPGTSNDLSTGDFTIEFWVNAVTWSATTSYSIANLYAPVDVGFGLNGAFGISSDPTFALGVTLYNWGGAVGDGTVVTIPLSSLSTSTWYHMAFTRASGTTRAFLNGVLIASSTKSYTGNFGTNPIYIGAGPSNGWFNGYISNLRVVKGTAVYTAAFTPSTTPLTAVSGTVLLTNQSNRFIDNSSNNFTITKAGDTSVQRFSPFAPSAAYSTATIGGSGYFDGSGDYLASANTVTAAGDFTFECWFYRTSAVNHTIFSIGAEGGGRKLFGVASDNRIFIDNYGGPQYYFGGNVPANAWSHIAFTRSGSTVTAYYNGVATGTTNTISGTFGAASNFYVGAVSGGGGPLVGYVTDARWVVGSVVYTGNFTPPTAPVTAITNTSVLLNFTNGSIFDNAMMNDLETVGNAQISTSVKKYGTGSLAFDGTGDWLLVPHSVDQQLGTGNFTIECWLYLGATGAARGVVGKGTATTGWLLSTDSSNKVVFSYASSTITSSGALSGSTWYHIAVVREGTGSNQTKIYIAGTNDGTGTVSTDFTQTNAMYVGANRTGGDALNGNIDDLRITKGYARYTANFTPPTSQLQDQ